MFPGFHQSMMIMGLSYTAFIMLRYIYSTLTLWKVFFKITNEYWILSPDFFLQLLRKSSCHPFSTPEKALPGVQSPLHCVLTWQTERDISLSLLVSIVFPSWEFQPHQFNSVTQSCPILCSPMDCKKPDFPVQHQLPELAQIVESTKCVNNSWALSLLLDV